MKSPLLRNIRKIELMLSILKVDVWGTNAIITDEGWCYYLNHSHAKVRTAALRHRQWLKSTKHRRIKMAD